MLSHKREMSWRVLRKLKDNDHIDKVKDYIAQLLKLNEDVEKQG